MRCYIILTVVCFALLPIPPFDHYYKQIIFIYRHRPMTLAEANGMVSLRGALHVPSLEIREHFLFWRAKNLLVATEGPHRPLFSSPSS